MAKQLEMMYEGKAKQVFATDDPTLAVIHYKDDATAFNGLKKGTIVGSVSSVRKQSSSCLQKSNQAGFLLFQSSD